jgi:preprotein translocase SecF subunit
MFSLVQKWRWYFLISTILIAVGIASMVYSTITFGMPLRLGIDFTGGTLLELSFKQPLNLADARAIIVEAGYADANVSVARSATGEETLAIRTKAIQSEAKVALENSLASKFGSFTELRFDSVGPTLGAETTRAALFAIVAASVAILVFIAIAFHKVPEPLRWGVCAIVEMLHDILILLSFASLMGILANWEVDSLFLTAVLTVAGFSVQDAIVVFDRIRENLVRRRGEPFQVIVNRSLLETIHRSLATQLSVMFVLVAITLFGGITTRHFVITMLLGMFSGAYSSLFIGVPLLVVWEHGEIGQFFRGLFGKRAVD